MVSREARGNGRLNIQIGRTCNKPVAAGPIPRDSVQIDYGAVATATVSDAAVDNAAVALDRAVVAAAAVVVVTRNVVAATAAAAAIAAAVAAEDCTVVDKNIAVVAAAASGLCRHAYRYHCRPGFHRHDLRRYSGLHVPSVVLPDRLSTCNQRPGHGRPSRPVAS